MTDTAYKVELDQFHGPLDLLLYLIKSQEIDIYNIPVSVIADQYLGYLDTLALLDINVAGDFLVMAATLVELKSRVLLPTETRGEDELDDVEDPRSDLVRKLLEYKQFRDLAERLERLLEGAEARYVRGGSVIKGMAGPDAPGAEDEEEGSIEASLWDLLAAFQLLVRQLALSAPQTIVYDETPIRVHMQRLLELLRVRRTARFIDLFDGRRDRGFIIGTFLAILELCKLSALRAEDGEGFDLVIRYTGSDDLDLSAHFDVTYDHPGVVTAPADDDLASALPLTADGASELSMPDDSALENSAAREDAQASWFEPESDDDSTEDEDEDLEGRGLVAWVDELEAELQRTRPPEQKPAPTSLPESSEPRAPSEEAATDELADRPPTDASPEDSE